MSDNEVLPYIEDGQDSVPDEKVRFIPPKLILPKMGSQSDESDMVSPISPKMTRFDVPEDEPITRERKTGHSVPKERQDFSKKMSVKRQETIQSMRKFSAVTLSPVDVKDENQERGNFSNQIEFFLSCLGSAVGLGNVWRFPYLVHQYGGGAFLIPYFIMLFFCGIPLLMLELSMGQYYSQGAITIWKDVFPMAKGLGISMIISSLILGAYYNVITSWGIYYIYASLRKEILWTCCDPAWAKPGCKSLDESCSALNQSFVPFPEVNMSTLTANTSISNKTHYPADDYFNYAVLNIGPDLNNVGAPQPHLLIPLIIAWGVVFLVLTKGVKTIGKAVYFTSTFPYFVLLALLIRAAIEPGAAKGILYYLTPKWHLLLSPEVWGAAASQIFYSTGVAGGQMIALASYSRKDNNIYRDVLVIGLGNSATSIYSGFVVFSILGVMATRQGLSVEDVVSGGPGLTFITYPQAITLLPLPQFWSVLFFVMLITLAWSTMFPLVECITTAVIDNFPKMRPWKFWIMTSTVLVQSVIGLAITTRGGMYVLEMMDRFAVGNVIVIAGLIELIIFGWFYGSKKVMANINEMTGTRMTIIWQLLWQFICPALLTFALIFSWISAKPPSYGNYTFDTWAVNVGWCMTALILSAIVIYPLYIKFLRKYFTRGSDTRFF